MSFAYKEQDCLGGGLISGKAQANCFALRETRNRNQDVSRTSVKDCSLLAHAISEYSLNFV